MLAGGCTKRQAPDAPAPSSLEKYAELPGLKSTANARLRDQLLRITEDGGTPEQLSQSSLAEGDNVAVALGEVLPPAKVKSLWERSEKIWPPRGFEFDPIRLQKAIDFCREHQAERRKVRELLTRPRCPLGIRFSAGFSADLRVIDLVRLAARWEAFQAAQSLAENHLAAAIDAFSLMLRLAACLAAERHPVARLEAAAVRSEAFRVAAAVVQHEKIARRELERLHEAVCAHWDAWSSDADAWIGDRALGLHTYEMIRGGELARLLTMAELERFEHEGNLRELAPAALRTVDEDELYYLEAMQKIIDSCRQSYAARTAVLETIESDLRQKQDTPEFPLVAARLLLPGIGQGHLIQVQDRANCTAWALALAMATGRDWSRYQLNPLTGKPYPTSQQGRWIGVAAGEGCSIQVPAPAESEDPGP